MHQNDNQAPELKREKQRQEEKSQPRATNLPHTEGVTFPGDIQGPGAAESCVKISVEMF